MGTKRALVRQAIYLQQIKSCLGWLSVVPTEENRIDLSPGELWINQSTFQLYVMLMVRLLV